MDAGVFAAAFAALYAGHMVGDHVAQTDHQAAHKAGKGMRGAAAMAGHVTSYTACQGLTLLGLHVIGAPLTAFGVCLGLTFSAASHGFIDRRWPVQWLLRHTGSSNFASLASGGLNGPYLTDQALHIGCLYIAALIIAGGAA